MSRTGQSEKLRQAEKIKKEGDVSEKIHFKTGGREEETNRVDLLY